MGILQVQHVGMLAVSVFAGIAAGVITAGVAKYIGVNNFVIGAILAISLALSALLIYKWPEVA